MKSFSEIKDTSREQLLDNWKLPVLLTFIGLVLGGIYIFFDEDMSSLGITISITVSILANILAIFITNIMLNIAKYNEVKSVKIPLKKFLKIIGAAFIVFAPMFILIMLVIIGSIFGLMRLTDSLTPIVITIITINILCFMVGIYLSFINYLILEDYKVFQSIKYSVLYMKGNLLKTLWLFITFIPWILLSIITLGLGHLYVGPYLQLIYTNYYLELKNEFNSKKE